MGRPSCCSTATKTGSPRPHGRSPRPAAEPSHGCTTPPTSTRRLFDWIDGEFGRVDFLANIAGDGLIADPLEVTPEQIRRVLENLVVGRFAHCREAARRMFRQGGGSIVNIGSIGGVSSLGRGHIAYAMAMGAVAQMTRELSTEWAARGVRVNAILPAQVMNPGIEQRIAADPAIEKKWLSGIPRGRLGRPEHVQGLIVLLLLTLPPTWYQPGC